MHLAYLDESILPGEIAIVGAVVIPSGNFGWAERMHSIAVEQLFAPEEIEEKFEEFHAHELFKGEGAFKGMDQEKRYVAIRVLLATLPHYGFPFIYAAIDSKKLAKSELSKSFFGIANPLTSALKMCALGVEKWAQSMHVQHVGAVHVDYKDQYLFILDDTKDQELKKQLRSAYRLMRASQPYNRLGLIRLYHAHDEMYFGNSRDSVGIQIADLCTYFMQRRLMKRDLSLRDDADQFFEIFSEKAICAKPEPEWTTYRELFLEHRT